MAAPLLLAAREVARGSVASLPADFEVVASAVSAAHHAVLLRSRTERNCVRLGVFKTDEDRCAEEPEFIHLLPESVDAEASEGHNDIWTLVWSPDRKFLVISGRIPGAEGESQAVLWIFARREWVTSTATSESSPLLLRVDPVQYLAAKHWNAGTNVVNVFFPSQTGSKMFVVSEDGVWLSLNVQLAKLALVSMDPSVSDETNGLFTMKVVKNLTEWHAGVTAACYDSESATLVVSGGVRDPSVDLIEKQASSLSVWKVVGEKDTKDVGELLDFTMVVKGKKQQVSDEAIEDDQSDLVSVVEEESGGLLASVKSTLFAPLKMMVGGETTETRMMRGFIRHLALSPNGNFVSMVDDLGRIAIRQIDACTDVLKWQTVEDVSAKIDAIAMKQVVWLASDLVALLLANGNVVCSRLISLSEEGVASGPTSSDSENEGMSLSGSTGRLVLAPVKYHRPSTGAATGSIRTLALDAIATVSTAKHSAVFSACEFAVLGDVWTASQVQNLAVELFIELLIGAQQFQDALETVALCGNSINADDIHRRIWMDYRNEAGRLIEGNVSDANLRDIVFLSTLPQQRGERGGFVEALDHLRAITDKQWVLCECLKLVADDSSANMKKILNVAWESLNNDDEDTAELPQEKVDLQRYVYRLETLRLIMCEEEGVSTTSLTGDQLFDGATYTLFRTSSILSTAKQFSREGRIGALTVLFRRHGWNLVPRWLDILEMLPPSLSPSAYALLLPAMPTQMEDDGQFCTLSTFDDLSTLDGDDNDLATPVALLPENQLQDLTSEELSEFEEFSSVQREGRITAYGEWFSRRTLELDSRYGQLAFAYELSKLAFKCLRGWSSPETKKPFEELFLHTERLYKCVYPMHLSACCLLPLMEWSSLSMKDQAMIVVETEDKEISGDIAAITDRLDMVFVSQRQDRVYALDDLFTWLAKTISSKSSLTSLTLAAQLIQRSNPSINRTKRWIQSDVRLIETALDVVYAVDVSDIIGDKRPGVNEDVYMQRHLALVEQLWIIFQSLPVRKENDPPEVAQLQVAVDEMEDLMITMDILSKYGIVSSPSGLRYQMLASSGNGMGTSVGPHGLLEQMCAFALPREYSDDEENGDGNQWLEVLQDAVKLKEHAFGERLSQEMILDIILKHLLAPDRAYIDAAQNLVNHWIASDIEAVDHVLAGLFVAIQVKLDSVTGYSEDANANITHEAALGCIGIVKQLLSLPVWDEGDREIAGAKQYYENILSVETDRAHACELLDLLTYGAVKMSPSQLRETQAEEEVKENIRLDAVCQVFVSNPSNYKPSARAREWLAQHDAGVTGLAEGETAADLWNEPLAAVMYLAKLLRVDAQKMVIWMKGAYAALYCMDYDVAYDLTMQVIDGIPREVDAVATSPSGSKETFTLLHLISLVLDLVSASPFQSWSKKHKLCSSLFSSANVSSSNLFAHQVTDLILSWLEKIEVIQALMIELGLSDNDLEQRRLAGGKTTSSAESVLLNELKVVVDLLHEEKNDRQFLLRLLQRGFQLTQVMSNNVTGSESQSNIESVLAFLQQMIRLCVEEAMTFTSNPSTSESVDWHQYLELGFSYLILWGDLCSDDDNFKAFCSDELLSVVFADQAALDSSVASHNESVKTSDVVVRRVHHFFLFQAAQANENATENDTQALRTRRNRLETLSSSYDSTRRVVSPVDDAHHHALGDVPVAEEELLKPQLLVSEKRYQIYVELAQRCQERLVSQKKSQELEQMSTFFNTELDLERFSQDESYRNEKIMLLATKKEHFQLSRQFANKYGINDFDCVLAYIKHALIFPPDCNQMGRREQLDQAFAIEQVDILEEALQNPVHFGEFLLKKGTTGEPSLYEKIDGTDHVGILLVLRMILECSKRIHHESTESVSSLDRALFPLSKPSMDRVTLLFMCMKKIKDIGDSLDIVDPVDLKLIGTASTTAELLTPLVSAHMDPQTLKANREIAIEAVRPLLTGKTIKFVTKILRKLHRVTPSSMVMIYINDLLTGIWSEHRTTGSGMDSLSADLAVYAYESCVPCLSVLSNEHLMLFHHLFLDGSSGKSPPESVAHLNVEEEFYGQSLNGLRHFGALLTPQKRVELVTDTLTLFQTKYNSWQTSGPRSNVSSASSTSSTSSVSWDPTQFRRKEQELRYLEHELVNNVCSLVLSEMEQIDLVLAAGENKENISMSNLKTWFAMDSLQQATSEETLQNTVLLELCQSIDSVNLASLVMELVLRAGGRKASKETAASTIAQSYQNVAVNLINRCIGSGEDGALDVPWVEQFVWTWVTDSNVTSCNQIAELGYFLEATCSSRDKNTEASAIYERVVKMLSQSPSVLLKEIGLSRLSEMQTTVDESVVNGNDGHSASVVVSVRHAVLSQWKQLISIREEQRNWTEVAVLSHVLVTRASAGLDAAKWHFGHYVKAVWSALLAKHKLDESVDAQRVFEVPSSDILDHFTAIFEELLSFVELCASDDNPKALKFAEMATVALSNLLVRHDELGGVAERSAMAWQEEQKRAVKSRIQAQFQVGAGIEKKASHQSDQESSWSALFARGVWGVRLLNWYTEHAYAELSREEEITEAVILVHWEANNLDLAIQLLLMCPFDGLREKYVDRALSVVRHLPQGSRSWSTVMEFALLRFDTHVLLQHGLHASVVAFLLQYSSRNPPLWTSSGNYVVCALVAQGEFAAAGRLTCALRHAHPLLWDMENARLLLANYLRSLASSEQQKSKNIKDEIAHLQHEVYAKTSRRFADALL